MKNAVKDAKFVRPINATAAGTSVITAAATIDMQGYDAICAAALLGTLTATQVTSLEIQWGNASNGSDKVAVTGSKTGNAADGDSNKMLVLDCQKPSGYRYATVIVNRATANAVVDGVMCFLYQASALPVTQPTANVSQSTTVVIPTP